MSEGLMYAAWKNFFFMLRKDQTQIQSQLRDSMYYSALC